VSVLPLHTALVASPATELHLYFEVLYVVIVGTIDAFILVDYLFKPYTYFQAACVVLWIAFTAWGFVELAL